MNRERERLEHRWIRTGDLLITTSDLMIRNQQVVHPSCSPRSNRAGPRCSDRNGRQKGARAGVGLPVDETVAIAPMLFPGFKALVQYGPFLPPHSPRYRVQRRDAQNSLMRAMMSPLVVPEMPGQHLSLIKTSSA